MTTEISPEQRTQIAHSVMSLFSAWGLDVRQQAVLLGLPEDTKTRALSRYRSGTPFPDDPDLMARVGKLLSIQNSLDTCFPHNPSMANYWVTTPNMQFNDETPLAFMLEHGLDGIDMVARHLTGGDNW